MVNKKIEFQKISFKFSLLTLLFLAVAVFLFMPSIAFGAARYWVGTAGGNWNTTASWSTTDSACETNTGASVPGSSDIAYFSTCTNNATVNANVDVSGINIASGYSGTIDARGYAFIVRNGGFTQAGGTFEAPTGTLTLVATAAAGFSRTGGTFNHNDGTIAFGSSTTYTVLAGGATFKNLSFDMFGGFVKLQDSFTIAGNVSIANLTSSTGGGIQSYSSAQTITINGNLTFLDSPAGGAEFGSLTAANNLNINLAGNLTVGTNDAINKYNIYANINFNGDDGSGGPKDQTITANADNVFIASTWTITKPHGGTVYTSGATITTGRLYVGAAVALILDSANDHFSTAGSTPTTSLTLASIAFSGGTLVGPSTTLALTGNYTQSGGTSFTAPTTMTVGGAFSLTGSSTFTGGTTMSAVGITLTSSTFTAPSGTLTCSSTFSRSGGTFTHNGGTVFFGGNSTYTVLTDTAEFNNVTFDLPNGYVKFKDSLTAAGNVSVINSSAATGSHILSETAAQTITIKGNLTFQDSPAGGTEFGSLTTPAVNNLNINLAGNLTVGTNATNKYNIYANINFNGDDGSGGPKDQTITANTDNVFIASTWTITKPHGGTVYTSGATITTGRAFVGIAVTLVLDASTDVFSVMGTTPTTALTILKLDMSAGTFTAPSGTLTCTGEFKRSGGNFIHNSGTVSLTGQTAAYNLTSVNSGTTDSFYNLTIYSNNAYTLASSLLVINNLSITASKLDVSASNYAITVGGNWLNSVGTTAGFNARSGTVTFNGSLQTITGATTFYNLTIDSANTPTIKFPSGVTQTIGGAFVAGTTTSSNRITITSSDGATQATLNKTSAGTVKVYKCTLNYSAATGSGVVWQAYTSRGNIDGTTVTGTNSGWIFNAPVIDYYWVGGDVNTLTSNAKNWKNGSVGDCYTETTNAELPTDTDNLHFTSGCSNATVDADLSVKNVSLETGYTGTVTQSDGLLSVAGDLTVTAGTLQLGAYDFTVSGATSITGTFGDNSATGTNLFVGAVTINSGGVWSTSNNPAFTFRHGLANNSSAGFTSGTGAYTFETNAQTLTGSQAFTITNVANSITDSTGLTLSDSKPTIGTLTQASSAQLTFSGVEPTITTLTASASGNTVTYSSASGSQSVFGVVYQNLTLGNSSGTNTAGGSFTVNGTFTTTAGGTLNMGSSSVLTLGGSSTVASSGIISTAVPTSTSAVPIPSGKTWGGTVIYASTSGQAQTLMAGSYENLTISGGGTKTLSGVANASGILTLTSGVVITTPSYYLNVTNTSSSAVTGYSSTSYVAGSLQWALADGSSYTFPVSDPAYLGDSAYYSKLEMDSISCTSPVIKVTTLASGASTVDSSLASVYPFNWHTELISGSCTSATIKLTQLKYTLTSNNVVGSSLAQSGDYTSLGAGTVTTYTATSPAGTSYTESTYFAIGSLPSTITISNNGTQVAAANVPGGTTNLVLHKSKLVIADADAALTGMTATTQGTYVSDDVTNLKAYYSTSSTFDSGTATLLSTLANPGAAGAKTFPSFTSQTIAAGATGYIYITADTAENAVLGDTINLAALNVGDFTISGLKFGSTTAGGSQTFALMNYYNKAASYLHLDELGSWTTTPTGGAGGSAPPSFTAANQIFNIINGSTATILNPWTVSGTNSKIIVGKADGTSTVNFTAPAAYLLTTNAIDVLDNATLTIKHLTIPTFGTLSSAGIVSYGGTAAQTIVSTSYGILKTSAASLKTAAGDITAVTLDNGGDSNLAATLNMAEYTLNVTSSIDNTNATIKFSGASNGIPVSTGTVEYSATTGSQNIAGGTYSTLKLDNSSGTNTVTGSDLTTAALTTTAGGTLNMGTFALNTTAAPTGTAAIQTQSASATPITAGLTWPGAMLFNGSSAQTIPASTFSGNLTLNNSAGATLSGDVSVVGNLTITSGTLDVSSSNHALSVSGNWSNSGTFTPHSGTVTLSPTASQTISGSTTFYNLTKSVTAAATLTFTAGTTQTITGAMTLNGASGKLLSLRSSSSPTQWSINPQGTRTIAYLDVKDSNNVNTTAIDARGTNSTDSLNNINWTFNTVPSIPVLVSPADGFISNDTTPTLSATYSDDDTGDVGTTSYRVATSSANCLSGTTVSSGTSSTTATNNETTTWTPASSIGGSGTYYWCAQNNDGATTSAWTSMGSIVLDITAPTVLNVTSSLDDGTYTVGQLIPIQVVFSKAVTVTGTPRLAIATGTPATTAVNYVSGSTTDTLTFNYTVIAGNHSADLDYTTTSALALNSGTIKDSLGNDAVLTLASPGAANSLGYNKNIVVDTNNHPTATSVSVSPTSSEVTDSLTFTGTWTEPDAGDKDKMYVCKDYSCSNCNNITHTNCWCYSASYQTQPDQTDTCSYTAQTSDIGTRNYWLGVCDDNPSCSESVFGGSFLVGPNTASSLTIKGGSLKVSGGSKLRIK